MNENHDKGPRTARIGRWLPHEPDAIDAWAHGFARKVAAKGPVKLHPVIEEFADLIAQDAIVRMYVTSMIAEVPKSKRYREHHLKSVEQMLALINALLTHAPEFDTTALVGCPLNAILDWSMGTPAGFAAFRHPPINAMLKKIMSAWCQFLSSEASLYVLNDGPNGWKCAEAQRLTRMEEFEHNPAHPSWGFSSWNDFFTRRFKPGRRPIAHANDDRVVVSACESTPYRIAKHVKRQDAFWIKGQPYSVQDMLANDPAAGDFVGGTIYQAYLNPFNYHRWHSPVSGTILKAVQVDGTYFSEAECEGEDPAGPNNSQAYITHVAARAIIHIKADDPKIGPMVVMPVGMAEVSSCVIDPKIKAGARVAKGAELVHFQYGGSTHCLIFRPGAIEAFASDALPEPENPDAPLKLVNSYLATAAK
jgi:phosphatidylserine decarboxylase